LQHGTAISVRLHGITSISTRKTSAIAALLLFTADHGGIGANTLDCRRVWPKDQRTIHIMDQHGHSDGGKDCRNNSNKGGNAKDCHCDGHPDNGNNKNRGCGNAYGVPNRDAKSQGKGR
jgi:hypothetical protein